MFHTWRRHLFNIFSGAKLTWLDPYLRSHRGSEEQKRSWFHDQYQHPQESTHTYGEVLNLWFEDHSVEFISAIPPIAFDDKVTSATRLFERKNPGTVADRILGQLRLIWSASHEGGFFIMMGRRAAP